MCALNVWPFSSQFLTVFQTTTTSPALAHGPLIPHLLDFCHVPDEAFIFHKVQEFLQLIQVGDVVFPNALEEEMGRENSPQAPQEVWSVGRAPSTTATRRGTPSSPLCAVHFPSPFLSEQ